MSVLDTFEAPRLQRLEKRTCIRDGRHRGTALSVSPVAVNCKCKRGCRYTSLCAFCRSPVFEFLGLGSVVNSLLMCLRLPLGRLPR